MPDYHQMYYEIHTVIDHSVVAEGRVVATTDATDLGEWSGGAFESRDGETVFVVPAGSVSAEAVARLGDTLMKRGVELWVEPADSLNQRWLPADTADPTSPPDRMYAPFTLTYGPNPWF